MCGRHKGVFDVYTNNVKNHKRTEEFMECDIFKKIV